MAKQDHLHMKIDAELKEKLRKEAEAQNRTIANLVETILKQYLDGDKK